MPLRRLGPALLALTLGATISWEGLARRGDDAPVAAPAPAPALAAPPSAGAPAVWVTAFEDGTLRPARADELGLGPRPTQSADPIGRCATWEARAGRCLEFVRFVRREQLFGGGSVDRPQDDAQRDADRLTLAMRRGLSSLYLALWDGLVARWRRDGETLGAQLAELEVSTLPDSSALWSASRAVSRRITALPDAARWLLEDEWLAPDKASEGRAPFRRLRVTSPRSSSAEAQPVVRTPELALLRGRFAVGFVLDAKPFDADLIRLPDRGTMLFLRQLYPHAVEELERGGSAVAGCLESNAPLECMRADELPKDSPRWIQTLGPGDDPRARAVIAEQAARDQFTAFADLVGMRLLQYGRFEFDISLIRAMGALVAMTAPPVAGPAAALIGDDINDSIVGESDAPSTGRRARALRPPTSSTSIHYDAILEDDVKALMGLLELTGDERCLGGAQTVPELTAADAPDSQAPRLLDLTFTRLGALVNTKSPLHYRVAEEAFTPAELEAATKRYLDLGDEAFRAALLTHDDLAPNSEQLVGAELDRLILENRLEGRCAPSTEATLSRAEQVRRLERLRSRVLFAQVRDALTPKLPKAGDDPGTPSGVEAEAQSAWTAVMTQHGSTPKRVERDGGENVHPLAVCTTKDGAEAMAEPVFKRISVEALLVADAKATPDQALWESRAALPFLWVDDPTKSRPVVTQLVQLGDGLAIYKARWELWAGWHLLWGVSGDGDKMTLSGYSSAICEDMVLTPPALVATLVRGGLLDAPLRGTRPVRRADVPEREAPPPPPTTTSDERLLATQSAAETAQAAAGAAELSAAQLASNPENSLTMARSKAGQATDLANALSERPELTGRDTPAAEYLRELVQGPLLTRARGEAAVLIVADVTKERGRTGARQLVPSTPYLQRRERLGHGERLRLAAWALVLPPLPLPLQEPNVAVLPARLPNASVQATSVRPGWARDPLTELTLVADIGLFGRVVNIGCDADEFGKGYPPFAGCEGDLDGELPPYIGSVYSVGPGVSLASLGTTWLSHEPRVAIEYGAEAQIELVLREESSGAFADLDDVALAWMFTARGGVLVGVRLAVDPVWMTRLVRGVRLESGAPSPRLWGAEGDNGRSQLARTQVGLRAGASLEPWTTIGGPPLVLSAEAWMGWSRWRSRSAWAMITPYQPSALVGPYVRYLYAIQAPWWESGDDEMDPLQLLNRHQLVIGVRVQPRFDAARINLPEPQ